MKRREKRESVFDVFCGGSQFCSFFVCACLFCMFVDFFDGRQQAYARSFVCWINTSHARIMTFLMRVCVDTCAEWFVTKKKPEHREHQKREQQHQKGKKLSRTTMGDASVRHGLWPQTFQRERGKDALRSQSIRLLLLLRHNHRSKPFFGGLLFPLLHQCCGTRANFLFLGIKKKWNGQIRSFM